MKQIIIIVALLSLIGCGAPRAIKVGCPESTVTDDRVVNLATVRNVDIELVVKLIESLPPEQRKDVINRIIDKGERLAGRALDRESERAQNYVGTFKMILNIIESGGVIAAIAAALLN
jgi:hypothetical protein